MPYLLFLKKQQNLTLSSVVCRWRFMQFKKDIQMIVPSDFYLDCIKFSTFWWFKCFSQKFNRPLSHTSEWQKNPWADGDFFYPIKLFILNEYTIHCTISMEWFVWYFKGLPVKISIKGPVVQEEMTFKEISNLEIWMPICAILVSGVLWGKILWNYFEFGPDFLSRALAALLFGGVEPFVQFSKREPWGTFMWSYLKFRPVVQEEM